MLGLWIGDVALAQAPAVSTTAPAASPASRIRLNLNLPENYTDHPAIPIEGPRLQDDRAGGLIKNAHVGYQIAPNLAAGVGVTSSDDRTYFQFRPFPRRTVIDLKYRY